MAELLFKIVLTNAEATKMSKALRQAAKKVAGKQDELNSLFAGICTKYGHADPGSCQMAVIGYTLYVSDYPSLEEIIATTTGDGQGKEVAGE